MIPGGPHCCSVTLYLNTNSCSALMESTPWRSVRQAVWCCAGGKQSWCNEPQKQWRWRSPVVGSCIYLGLQWVTWWPFQTKPWNLIALKYFSQNDLMSSYFLSNRTLRMHMQVANAQFSWTCLCYTLKQSLQSLTADLGLIFFFKDKYVTLVTELSLAPSVLSNVRLDNVWL